MKIDLGKIDREQFRVQEGVIAGETCYLVTPEHIGAKWNKDNLNLRSSIWTKDGDPVSLSFKKFKNWGEDYDNFPEPKTLDNCNLVEKLDGSTLIVSRFKDELIVRTRGTFSCENNPDIEILKRKYPLVFTRLGECVSFLFEWVTPNNRIVIDYGNEPDLYLIGAVNHEDYSLYAQKDLDELALSLKVKRPARFNFGSTKEMLESIEQLKGQEGLCVYFNSDQDIKKVKGSWYLALHRFKEHCNEESIIDLYLEYGMPNLDDFLEKLEKSFDFECMMLAKPIAIDVCKRGVCMREVERGMKEFIKHLGLLSLRKMKAESIIKEYAHQNLASFAFQMLDGKEFTKETYKKLINIV